MALVHSDLAFLLDALVPTALAPLASDALALIAAEPAPDMPFREPQRGRPDPVEARHVLRQLHLIEQAIFYRLKDERSMGARISELAEGLKLSHVYVLSSEDDDEAVAEASLDDLASGQRLEAIKQFADIYWEALTSVRNRWETPR